MNASTPPFRQSAYEWMKMAAALAVIVFSGCAGETETATDEVGEAPAETSVDRPGEMPDAPDSPASERDIAPSLPAAEKRTGETESEYDWETISSVGIIRGTRELMNLLRHLDVQHRGEHETIRIEWTQPGAAVDEFGHRVTIIAEEWKAILEAVADRAARSDDGISRWRAMPPGMYHDGFDHLTRYNYRVFIESNERLRFENEGPHE